ncbi:MAG: sugar ABC transporter ATP-binding protein [Chthoniobacteraceae bacterium]
MRLEASGIYKHYGPATALGGAGIALRQGEIHALLGENGAGKSTLARILSGSEPPDAGTVLIDDRPYEPREPLEAIHQGVAFVGPVSRLAPDLTVEQNIVLGLEPERNGWIDHARLREQATWALGELQSLDLPLDARVATLGPADRQRVEIARALMAGSRVLILDEPTRSLSHWETGPLFTTLRHLARGGVAILFVSHFLEEAFALCDRFTVLREGRSVASGLMAETTRPALLEAMAGEPVDETFRPRIAERHRGRGVLWLEGACGREAVRGVTLTLHEGEILGLTGLDGAGRRELLRLVMRSEPLRRGKIWRGGSVAMAAPADDAVFKSMDVADNLTLPALSKYSKLGFISLEDQASAAQDWIAKLHLRARSPRQRAATLSGGARQKLRLGRLLIQPASVLLLDEPARGLDFRSRLEIYRLVDAIAAEGKGILWAGSDPGELLRVCDTIALLRHGELVDSRPSGEWTEPEMIAAALGTP